MNKIFILAIFSILTIPWVQAEPNPRHSGIRVVRKNAQDEDAAPVQDGSAAIAVASTGAVSNAGTTTVTSSSSSSASQTQTAVAASSSSGSTTAPPTSYMAELVGKLQAIFNVKEKSEVDKILLALTGTSNTHDAIEYFKTVTNYKTTDQVLRVLQACVGSRGIDYTIKFMNLLQDSSKLEYIVELPKLLTNQSDVMAAFSGIESMNEHANIDGLIEILVTISLEKDLYEACDTFKHMGHGDGIAGVKAQIAVLTSGQGAAEFNKLMKTMENELSLRETMNEFITVMRTSNLKDTIQGFNELMGTNSFSDNIQDFKDAAGSDQFMYCLQDMTYKSGLLSLKDVIKKLYKMCRVKSLKEVNRMFQKVFKVRSIVSAFEDIKEITKDKDVILFLESLNEVANQKTIEGMAQVFTSLTTEDLNILQFLEKLKDETRCSNIIDYFHKLEAFTATTNIADAFEDIKSLTNTEDIFVFYSEVDKFTKSDMTLCMATIIKGTYSPNLRQASLKLAGITGKTNLLDACKAIYDTTNVDIVKFFEALITIDPVFDFEKVITRMQTYTHCKDLMCAISNLPKVTGQKDMLSAIEYMKENKQPIVPLTATSATSTVSTSTNQTESGSVNSTPAESTSNLTEVDSKTTSITENSATATVTQGGISPAPVSTVATTFGVTNQEGTATTVVEGTSSVTPTQDTSSISTTNVATSMVNQNGPSTAPTATTSGVTNQEVLSTTGTQSTSSVTPTQDASSLPTTNVATSTVNQNGPAVAPVGTVSTSSEVTKQEGPTTIVAQGASSVTPTQDTSSVTTTNVATSTVNQNGPSTAPVNTVSTTSGVTNQEVPTTTSAQSVSSVTTTEYTSPTPSKNVGTSTVNQNGLTPAPTDTVATTSGVTNQQDTTTTVGQDASAVTQDTSSMPTKNVTPVETVSTTSEVTNQAVLTTTGAQGTSSVTPTQDNSSIATKNLATSTVNQNGPSTATVYTVSTTSGVTNQAVPTTTGAQGASSVATPEDTSSIPSKNVTTSAVNQDKPAPSPVNAISTSPEVANQRGPATAVVQGASTVTTTEDTSSTTTKNVATSTVNQRGLTLAPRNAVSATSGVINQEVPTTTGAQGASSVTQDTSPIPTKNVAPVATVPTTAGVINQGASSATTTEDTSTKPDDKAPADSIQHSTDTATETTRTTSITATDSNASSVTTNPEATLTEPISITPTVANMVPSNSETTIKTLDTNARTRTTSLEPSTKQTSAKVLTTTELTTSADKAPVINYKESDSQISSTISNNTTNQSSQTPIAPIAQSNQDGIQSETTSTTPKLESPSKEDKLVDQPKVSNSELLETISSTNPPAITNTEETNYETSSTVAHSETSTQAHNIFATATPIRTSPITPPLVTNATTQSTLIVSKDSASNTEASSSILETTKSQDINIADTKPETTSTAVYPQSSTAPLHSVESTSVTSPELAPLGNNKLTNPEPSIDKSTPEVSESSVANAKIYFSRSNLPSSSTTNNKKQTKSEAPATVTDSEKSPLVPNIDETSLASNIRPSLPVSTQSTSGISQYSATNTESSSSTFTSANSIPETNTEGTRSEITTSEVTQSANPTNIKDKQNFIENAEKNVNVKSAPMKSNSDSTIQFHSINSPQINYDNTPNNKIKPNIGNTAQFTSEQNKISVQKTSKAPKSTFETDMNNVNDLNESNLEGVSPFDKVNEESKSKQIDENNSNPSTNGDNSNIIQDNKTPSSSEKTDLRNDSQNSDKSNSADSKENDDQQTLNQPSQSGAIFTNGSNENNPTETVEANNIGNDLVSRGVSNERGGSLENKNSNAQIYTTENSINTLKEGDSTLNNKPSKDENNSVENENSPENITSHSDEQTPTGSSENNQDDATSINGSNENKSTESVESNNIGQDNINQGKDEQISTESSENNQNDDTQDKSPILVNQHNRNQISSKHLEDTTNFSNQDALTNNENTATEDYTSNEENLGPIKDKSNVQNTQEIKINDSFMPDEDDTDVSSKDLTNKNEQIITSSDTYNNNEERNTMSTTEKSPPKNDNNNTEIVIKIKNPEEYKDTYPKREIVIDINKKTENHQNGGNEVKIVIDPKPILNDGSQGQTNSVSQISVETNNNNKKIETYGENEAPQENSANEKAETKNISPIAEGINNSNDLIQTSDEGYNTNDENGHNNNPSNALLDSQETMPSKPRIMIDTISDDTSNKSDFDNVDSKTKDGQLTDTNDAIDTENNSGASSSEIDVAKVETESYETNIDGTATDNDDAELPDKSMDSNSEENENPSPSIPETDDQPRIEIKTLQRDDSYEVDEGDSDIAETQTKTYVGATPQPLRPGEQPDSKYSTAQFKNERSGGKLSLSQGPRDIMHALETSMNLKLLLLPDGPQGKNCYCTCQTDTPPTLIELDPSKRIPDLDDLE